MKEPLNVLNVETFVRDLLKLGGIYNVSDDGYVVRKGEDDSNITLKSGSGPRPLMVFKDSFVDNGAAVINPLNENISETPDAEWLYITFNVGLVRRIVSIASFIRQVIVNESDEIDKTLSKAEQKIAAEQREIFRESVPTNVLQFASDNKDFDEKAFETLVSISEDKVSYIKIWYNRNHKKTYFRCPIYDADVRATFSGVSKKTWTAIINLTSDLLGVDRDPIAGAAQIAKKFVVSSDLITVPKLESTLTLYVKLYQLLNEYLELCKMNEPDFVVDITTLGYHIANLEGYYKKVRYFTCANTDTSPTRGQIRTIETSGYPDHNAHPATHPGGIPPNPARVQSGQFGQPQFQPSFQQSFRGPNFGGGSISIGGGSPNWNSQQPTFGQAQNIPTIQII